LVGGHHEVVALALSDERGRGLDRAVNFSDGVFAIAITLLVLSFRLPQVPSHGVDSRLLDALKDESGTFLGFAVSFYVIARYWMTHHRLSILLHHVDSTFIGLNLVLLASVVFLPFPTEIMGVYGDTRTAVVFDGLAMTLTGVLSTVVWQYALSRGLMDQRLTAAWRRGIWIRGLSVPVVFATSIPIAFVDTNAARYWWILLVVMQRGIRWWVPGWDEPFGRPARTG
jgi:uncharacterized membrane protein